MFSLTKWFNSLDNLGLPVFVVPELNDLKKYFRELSLKYHSDKCPGCDVEDMMRFSESYTYLKSNYSTGVGEYNNYLEQAHEQCFAFSSFKIEGNEELLGQLFHDCGAGNSDIMS